ncbi:MAG: metallophosphoesterase [Pseudomonadota bacterium]
MPFTLAHLSDTHTTDLRGVRPAQLLGKRLLGYLSWRRRRRYEHSTRMLEASADAALAHTPDAMVISGDLLHIGLAEEMRQIRGWLESLRAKLPVFLVPGNHDLYRADSVAWWQRELGDLDLFGAPLTDAPWPRTLLLAGARLIGLNSAYAAPLTRADGYLGAEQLEALRMALAEPCDAPTVLVVHHPADSSLCAARKALRDAAALAELLHEHPPALLLHGHLHKPLAYRVGTVPCFCAPSASSEHEHHRAGFHLFRLPPDPAAPVDARLYLADAACAPCGFTSQTRSIGSPSTVPV